MMDGSDCNDCAMFQKGIAPCFGPRMHVCRRDKTSMDCMLHHHLSHYEAWLVRPLFRPVVQEFRNFMISQLHKKARNADHHKWGSAHHSARYSDDLAEFRADHCSAENSKGATQDT